MNNLQRLDAERDYFVTLNLRERIDPGVGDRVGRLRPPGDHPRERRRAAPLGRDQRRRPDPLLRRLLALGLPRGRLLERAARLRAPRARRLSPRTPSWSSPRERSALYEGWVRHRRLDPVEHGFRYPIFMAYLDLAELPGGARPAAAAGRRGARRSPGFGAPITSGPADRPLDGVVRDRVAERTGTRPERADPAADQPALLRPLLQPGQLLLLLRRARARRSRPCSPTSTTPPGANRHAYVIGNPDAKRIVSGRLEKEFHVSPLMGMDHVYEWRTTVPGDDLQVHIASHRDGALAFDATLSLERRELASRTSPAGCWPATRR